MYEDDDMLKLSGIQHYAFCKRQWALIHVEQQWIENSRTIEGKYMHTRVDNPYEREKRGDTITIRAVGLVCRQLGLYGVADVVEYKKTTDTSGIAIDGYDGLWMPYPVEYKRGEPKPDSRDEVQLCAQAICLEEMHGIALADGALFYGETNRRVAVVFDDILRAETFRLASEMHSLFDNGETPKAEYAFHCKACSLKDICMPKELSQRTSVKAYLRKELDL